MSKRVRHQGASPPPAQLATNTGVTADSIQSNAFELSTPSIEIAFKNHEETYTEEATVGEDETRGIDTAETQQLNEDESNR